MIIDLEKESESELLNSVKAMAFSEIGDPAILSKWEAPNTFSDEEKYTLEKARKLLNYWLVSEFIHVFFDICINDESRREFWTEQVVHINRFRVFGSIYMKERLMQNKRIAKFVNSKFHVTSRDRDIAAIMIEINRHLFIEFSDTGFACQAYLLSSPQCPKMSASIDNVEQLRTNNLTLITQEMRSYRDFPPMGKFRHSGDWQGMINQFIQDQVLS